MIIVIFLFFYSSNIKSDHVISDDSYRLHTLTFDNLSTNNFFYYFSDIDVVRIYPYINPVYRDSLGDISYKVSSMNLGYEIDRFRKSYLSLIKKNSYLDYNYLFVNGIGIDKIDVYLSNSQLHDLLNSDLIINVVK